MVAMWPANSVFHQITGNQGGHGKPPSVNKRENQNYGHEMFLLYVSGEITV